MATTRMGEMRFVEHTIKVPLDWDAPERGEIEVFFREVSRADEASQALPLLLFLQGGPGGSSPRPLRWGIGWLNEALKHYRVILPDQRGTGRSSRISSATMASFESSEEAGEYLSLFDARAIINDFEHIRTHHYQQAQWATLGQSYGGFLTLTYLSFFPDALLRCYVTGGLPSLHPDADEVYRRTFPRAEAKLKAYLEEYPQDGEILDRLADYLQKEKVHLPNGDVLTVRRLQTLGMMLGMQTASDRLHWLLEEAFTDGGMHTLNPHFLSAIEAATSMDDMPLYAALQENIYAHPGRITQWAAQRQRDARPQFKETARPLKLTGEMVFPWMFDEIRELRAFKGAAEYLAHQEPRHAFYDPGQLAQNQVPVAAAVYHDDLYVDLELSLQTVAHIPNLRYWVTNEFEHDGLRVDSGVFKRLYKMVEGV